MQIPYLAACGRKLPGVKGGNIGSRKGNMRNFGSTNPHGTAFAPKQWLYQREAMGMESSKCIALAGADTVLTSVWPQTTQFHGG